MIIAKKKKEKWKEKYEEKGWLSKSWDISHLKNVYRVSITHGNADNMLMLKIKAEH